MAPRTRTASPPSARRAPGPTSVWILGDELFERHPALDAATERGGPIHVVMIESAARLARLPYHRKKQVLLLSAMRHRAQALREAGHRVDYRIAPDHVSALRSHVRERGTARLVATAATGWQMRRFQARLGATLGIPVEIVPGGAFLSDRVPEARIDAPPGRRTIMEPFYRRMRSRLELLLDERGEPLGGRWNFDAENRRPLPPRERPPAPRTFAPDAITRAVVAEVDRAGRGIGRAAGFELGVTPADARAALDDFVARRLPRFGTYQDAMRADDGVLYHSRLSPYLNLGLLDPLEAARAAEAAFLAGHAPINSAEGFVRQIVGWREYMWQQYWRLMPAMRDANAWEAERPVPRLFWDGETDMRCLRRVVGRVIDTGYAHHIERLMLLANFSLLAGVEPRAATDWFLAAFVDAYDWVMQPNVIGMGTAADGGLVATKPYIASGAYVRRMSDHCTGCRYDPRQRTGPDACPLTALYWSFLARHERRLADNRRTGPMLRGLERLAASERHAIRATADRFLDGLAWGPPSGALPE